VDGADQTHTLRRVQLEVRVKKLGLVLDKSSRVE
jgi:hypothetical protein